MIKGEKYGGNTPFLYTITKQLDASAKQYASNMYI